MANPFTIRAAHTTDADALLEIRREVIMAIAGVFAGVDEVTRWADSAGPERAKSAISHHKA